MDIRKLQRAIVDGLEEVKGQNIVVFNTEHLSPLFERVIIASGTSNRQTRALAASVRDAVKQKGFGPSRTEGEDNGEWIIVDCGAAVVHLMQPSIREYYHLEEIWGEKPVRLKLDGATKRLVKAAEPVAALAVAKKAGRSAAAGQVASPAARAQAPASSAKASGTARKRSAFDAARSQSTAPSKRTVARKAVTRVVGVKRGGAGSTAAAKAPARRAPGAKPAVKSPAKARPTAGGKATRRKA